MPNVGMGSRFNGDEASRTVRVSPLSTVIADVATTSKCLLLVRAPSHLLHEHQRTWLTPPNQDGD